MNPKWVIPAMAAAFLATPAMAEQVSLDRTAQVTFMQPVEVPGKVLPAGTYLFEEVELGKATRVWNADRSRLIGTFDTVPFEQRESEGASAVLLKKGPDNAPLRVDTWFYPGDSIGSEFVYPPPAGHRKTAGLAHRPVNLVEHGTAIVGASGLRSAELAATGKRFRGQTPNSHSSSGDGDSPLLLDLS